MKVGVKQNLAGRAGAGSNCAVAPVVASVVLTFTQPGAPPPARDFDLGEGFYSIEYSQKVSKLPYEHASERRGPVGYLGC